MGKMREARLRWFSHLMRKDEEESSKHSTGISSGRGKGARATEKEMGRLHWKGPGDDGIERGRYMGQEHLETHNPSGRPQDSLRPRLL